MEPQTKQNKNLEGKKKQPTNQQTKKQNQKASNLLTSKFRPQSCQLWSWHKERYRPIKKNSKPRIHSYIQANSTWTRISRVYNEERTHMLKPPPQHSCSHLVPCLPTISYCCRNMSVRHWHRKMT